MKPRPAHDALESEIADLETLVFPALQQRYGDLTGGVPPRRIGRKLLVLAIAYELQRKAYGVRVDRLMARIRAVKDERPETPSCARCIRTQTFTLAAASCANGGAGVTKSMSPMTAAF